jgi:uncharacterized DUF497 family protein
MRYVWDPAKDNLNRSKHGLSLADGIPALQDPDRDSWIDDRFDYVEERIVTLGMGKTQVLYVVSTELNEDSIRIISVRKADDDEIERYGFGLS